MNLTSNALYGSFDYVLTLLAIRDKFDPNLVLINVNKVKFY
jgi:hypothetical protein